MKKTKCMAINRIDLKKDIELDGEKIQQLNRFKYLGTIINNKGSK